MDDTVVYRCHHHVVWCPKYRREVIDGTVDERLKEIIREVRAERDARVETIEAMPDQVHLLVVVDPRYGIHRPVKQVKGPIITAAAPGVPASQVPDADPVDQLVLRRHDRRRHFGGGREVCREPTRRVTRR